MNHVLYGFGAPALFALVLAVRREVQGIVFQDDPLVGLYSLFMVIWSTILVKTWRRRAAVLSDRWGLSLLNKERGHDMIAANAAAGWRERLLRQTARGRGAGLLH